MRSTVAASKQLCTRTVSCIVLTPVPVLRSVEDAEEPVQVAANASQAIPLGDEATVNARLALLLTFSLSAVALWASFPMK